MGFYGYICLRLRLRNYAVVMFLWVSWCVYGFLGVNEFLAICGCI